MASLNKVFLIGNLTRDPELKYISEGTAVSNLRLAVNNRYRDQAGELKDNACFVTAVVWGKQAENCNQYLSKGSPVFIEGVLQSRSWQGQDGQKRNVIEVKARSVQFLGRPPAKSGQGEKDAALEERNESESQTDNISVDDNEVPF